MSWIFTLESRALHIILKQLLLEVINLSCYILDFIDKLLVSQFHAMWIYLNNFVLRQN